MKRIYFALGLVTFLFSFQLFSQSCPEISFVVPLPTEEVVFIYDDPGPPCIDRPTAIVIDGSAYSLGNCDSFSSRYVLSSGSGVIDPNNYTVTYGGLTCEYNNGTLLGLDDIEGIFEKTIKLYPNPATDQHQVQLSFTFPISGKITVYDLLGKVITSKQSGYQTKIPLDISGFNSGLYLVEIDTGSLVAIKKLVVKR